MKKPLEIFTPKQENFNFLDFKQKKIFRELVFTAKQRLYLSGGTALMLYLGHRTSVDFDFYRDKKFRKGALPRLFKENFNKREIVVARDLDDTFELTVDGVHISCFYYPYKLLGKLFRFNGVFIASLEDIAAMKALAIAQRGRRRDFIDIYHLIKIFGLKKILAWVKEKYPSYQSLIFLKGLTYFEEAERETVERNIRLFGSIPTWDKIKKEIIAEVKKCSMI